ncbi:MAG: OmpA family protein [Bacteroidales bacterium]
MKKLFTGILATGLLFTIASPANAQDGMNVKEKTGFVTNGFWDNWFIGIGGGAQVYYGEYSIDANFKDRIAPQASIEFGKWVAPGWGFRLKANGWEMKNFGLKSDPYLSGDVVDGLHVQKWNYINPHGDVMFDLMSMFGTYKPKRVYSLIPYFGMGVAIGEGDYQGVTAHAGLINRFRVSNAIDINLELQSTVFPDNFNGIVGGKVNDAVLGATLGITYKFKQRDFKAYDAMCPVKLAMINDQANQLRGQLSACEEQNSQLASALAACKAEKSPVVEQVIESGMLPFTSVLFPINKSVVRPDQKLALSNAAEMMKKNPDKVYTVVGYADKDTGTPEYNMVLSEKRANAVAKVLANEFGVNPSQLKVSWDGSGVQPFSKGTWNRVVIVEQAK